MNAMYFRAVLFVPCLASNAMAQFGPIQPVHYGISEIQEVLSADLDLDGDMDVVVLADLGTSLLRLENLDGLGTFGAPQVIRSGMAGYSEVALTDLNNDQYPDLAISTQSDSLVFWKPNLGNGLFGADVPTSLVAIALPSGFGALICANIAGDVLPEIIITSGDSLLWAINSTNGFLDRGGLLRDAGTFCPVLQAGDLDLDGDNDLIAVQSELTVFENSDGAGTTWTTTAFPSTIGWTSGKNMQLLDADADGDLDLLGQDHQTRWARNLHVEGQPWPSFTGEQIEPIHLSLNAGAAGHLGCGGTIDLVWRDLGSGVRWSSFDPITNAFADPLPLPDLPRGQRFHIADLNGDTRNDLIIAHNDSISWYSNGLALQDTISLDPPGILCADGGSIYLPFHTPIAGGIWSGPNVMNDLFNTGGLDAGTYALLYTVIDTTGCPLSGSMDVELIDAPTISTADPLLDPSCPGDQIQFLASPGGEWYGAADVNGYLYTGCDARPLFGEVILLYIDQTEGQCSASINLEILACGELAFGGPSVLCEDGPQQVITAQTGTFGSITMDGPLDSVVFVPPASVYGYFDPGQGPGFYTITASGGGPGECIAYDTLVVEVLPAITGLFLEPFDTLCIAAQNYVLDQGSLPGGLWSGEGVDTDLNTFTPPGIGDFTLTYAVFNKFCGAYASQPITVIAEVAIDPQLNGLICTSDPPVQLTAVPSDVVWDPPVTADGVFDPGTVPLNTQVIACAFTDVTGAVCPGFVTGFVMGALAPVSWNVTDTTYCVGDTVFLEAFGPVDYTYYSGGGIVEELALGCTFSASVPGVYQLIVGAQSPGECANADTLMLTVSDTAPLVEAPLLLPFCAGVGQTPIALPEGTPAGGIWSGLGVDNGSLDASSIGAGTFTLTYSASEPEYGCSASADVDVVVYDTVLVFAGLGDLLFCTDESGTIFSAQPEGGVWSTPIGSDGLFDPTTTGVGTYSVEYIWTGQGGCTLINAPQALIVADPVVPTIFLNGALAETGTLCPTDYPAVFTATPAFGSWGGTVPTPNDTLIIEVWQFPRARPFPSSPLHHRSRIARACPPWTTWWTSAPRSRRLKDPTRSRCVRTRHRIMW
ncbi:MAG: VCBS repeat-containing protein [Flavobacteriales bacterium]|nr:VCBS repeat-containing protein [Flavobacteriales bacterium]